MGTHLFDCWHHGQTKGSSSSNYCVTLYGPQKRRSCWTRKWILRREKLGAYHTLMNELQLEDPPEFSMFLRMSCSQFEEIFVLIAPSITKQDTLMRAAIPAKEKLALTLRFLATGKLHIFYYNCTCIPYTIYVPFSYPYRKTG